MKRKISYLKEEESEDSSGGGKIYIAVIKGGEEGSLGSRKINVGSPNVWSIITSSQEHSLYWGRRGLLNWL